MTTNTGYLFGLITIVLTTSCGSMSNDSGKLNEPVPFDSLTIVRPDSIQPTIQKHQPFASTFSIRELFTNQTGDVINAVAQEDFESAIKKIKHYWPDDSLLTETQKANFRYIHIYAMAGLIAQKKKVHSDLEKVLDAYKGKFIITQHLEITQGNKMPFNQIQVEQDRPDTIEITCANNKGFNIHCFVRATLVEKFDLTNHVGKRAYVCGRLAEYKLNHQDVYSWISDLRLSEGFIKILEDEFEIE